MLPTTDIMNKTAKEIIFVDQPNGSRSAPLHIACRYRQTETVKFLLQQAISEV